MPAFGLPIPQSAVKTTRRCESREKKRREARANGRRVSFFWSLAGTAFSRDKACVSACTRAKKHRAREREKARTRERERKRKSERGKKKKETDMERAVRCCQRLMAGARPLLVWLCGLLACPRCPPGHMWTLPVMVIATTCVAAVFDVVLFTALYVGGHPSDDPVYRHLVTTPFAIWIVFTCVVVVGIIARDWARGYRLDHMRRVYVLDTSSNFVLTTTIAAPSVDIETPAFDRVSYPPLHASEPTAVLAGETHGKTPGAGVVNTDVEYEAIGLEEGNAAECWTPQLLPTDWNGWTLCDYTRAPYTLGFERWMRLDGDLFCFTGRGSDYVGPFECKGYARHDALTDTTRLAWAQYYIGTHDQTVGHGGDGASCEHRATVTHTSDGTLMVDGTWHIAFLDPRYAPPGLLLGGDFCLAPV